MPDLKRECWSLACRACITNKNRGCSCCYYREPIARRILKCKQNLKGSASHVEALVALVGKTLCFINFKLLAGQRVDSSCGYTAVKEVYCEFFGLGLPRDVNLDFYIHRESG